MRKTLCGISILAGGLSRRMGSDKAVLLLGSKTLIERIEAEARKPGLPVRIIRRDLVPRCGPLGGVFTALKTSRAHAELFLACDMPFVTAQLLEDLLACWKLERRPVFTTAGQRAGFPFLLPCEALPIVERQIEEKERSVQKLVRALDAVIIRLPGERKQELFNVNTPAEWRPARERLQWP